jgi:hypothetical protein
MIINPPEYKSDRGKWSLWVIVCFLYHKYGAVRLSEIKTIKVLAVSVLAGVDQRSELSF